MNSFIAKNSPENPEVATPIFNDGFFPDLDITAFKNLMRINESITIERITQSLTAAMLNVNSELADYQQLQIDAGYSDLESVPGQSVGESTEQVFHYINAVHHFAKAMLSEVRRDHDTTYSGHKTEDRMEPTIDDHRRLGRNAISKLLKKPNMTVELI